MLKITKKTRLRKVYNQVELDKKSIKMLRGIMGVFEEFMTPDFLEKLTKAWNADSMVDGLNYLMKCAKQRNIFYDLYSEQEKAEDSSKKEASLIVFCRNEKSKCVFLVAGGGYESVCSIVEAFPVAKKLNEMGFSVFVLKYRSAQNAHYPHPTDDLARSIAFVKEYESELNVDLSDYIVMGFSAGGHLAASWGTESVGYKRYGLSRLGMLVLAYPVITMGKNAHLGSKRYLLGKNPTLEEINLYSVENQVTNNYPAVYMWQFDEDCTVSIENSKGMFEALTRENIPVKYELFHGNAHGVGEARGTEAQNWIEKAIIFYNKVITDM